MVEVLVERVSVTQWSSHTSPHFVVIWYYDIYKQEFLYFDYTCVKYHHQLPNFLQRRQLSTSCHHDHLYHHDQPQPTTTTTTTTTATR